MIISPFFMVNEPFHSPYSLLCCLYNRLYCYFFVNISINSKYWWLYFYIAYVPDPPCFMAIYLLIQHHISYRQLHMFYGPPPHPIGPWAHGPFDVSRAQCRYPEGRWGSSSVARWNSPLPLTELLTSAEEVNAEKHVHVMCTYIYMGKL